MQQYNLKINIKNKYDLQISCISDTILDSYNLIYDFIKKKYNNSLLLSYLSYDTYIENIKIKNNTTSLKPYIINSRINVYIDDLCLDIGHYN